MKKIKLIPILPIILAPVILFSPILFTGKTLFWGTPSTQFVPWWDFAWNSVLSGELPLWNPWVGMGAPLAANYQSAIFYPPYWIHLMFYALGGIKLMAWGISLVVVIHLIWAGLGTAKLLREIGLSKLAQTLGALSYSMSGYLIARAGFFSINAATSWIPWILLFSMNMAKGKEKSFRFTTIFLAFQFLAGHAQTAWYTVLFIALWTAFWAIINRGNKPAVQGIFVLWIKLISAGFLAAGISAIQLIPTIEYLLISHRSTEFGYLEAMTYSFWPWRFLTLLVPDLFGNPGSGNYWGYGNYWEDSIYVGLLPILLVIGIIFSVLSRKGYISKINQGNSQKEHGAIAVFLLCVIVLSFAFALGKNTILFPFLYKNVPTLDLFQAPTRFTIWAEISFAILAGIGIDNLRPPVGKRQYITRLAAAGCFSISAGALLANMFLPEIQATFISSIGKVGLLGLVIALSILFMPGKDDVEKSITWQWVIVFIVAIDLIVAGWKLNPGININYYQMNQSSSKQSRLFIPDDLEYDLKYNTFFKFGSFFPEEDWIKMKSYLLPNLNMLARIKMVNNFDPILPSRYVTWIDRLNKEGYRNHQQLLRLMNVGEILESSGKDGELDFQLSETDIHQIFLYPCALAMNEENEILDLLFSGNLDFINIVIIEGDQGQVAKLCSGKVGEFSVIQQSPLSMKINVDLDRDGWIFWSQTWYPGWKGKIDGMPVPVEKANYLFQAIYATSGQHIIEFHYQPESFMWGKIVTALSVFIFLTGIVISRRKSPQIN